MYVMIVMFSAKKFAIDGWYIYACIKKRDSEMYKLWKVKFFVLVLRQKHVFGSEALKNNFRHCQIHQLFLEVKTLPA